MKNSVRDIELPRIQHSPNDRAADPELVASVKEHGVLQPVALVAVANGFRPVYGTRRLDAARKAGLATIPATIYPASTPAADLHILTLTENIQRLDASPIEQGRLFLELVSMGLPIPEVARRVGRSPSYIAQRVQLATLPEHVRELLPPDYSVSALAILARLPQERLVRILEERPHLVASVDAAQDALREGDDLDAAPFDAAACKPCPKREGNVCLDEECFSDKSAAAVGQTIARIRKAHPAAQVVVSPDALDRASPTFRSLCQKSKALVLRDERVAAAGDEGKAPGARDAILLDGGTPKLVRLVPHARQKDGRANRPKTEEQKAHFAQQQKAARLALASLSALDDFLDKGKPTRTLDEKQLGHVALELAHALTGQAQTPGDAALVLLRALAPRVRAFVRDAVDVASSIDPAHVRDLSLAIIATFAADPDRTLAAIEKKA